MGAAPRDEEAIVATESELRDALRGASPTPGESGSTGLHGAEVIRRVRARRRPKQLAFGAAGALAVAGFAYLGVTTVPAPLGASLPASDGAVELDSSSGGPPSALVSPSDAPEQPVSGGDRLAADDANSCGAEVAVLPPNENGLVLTPRFPTVVPADGRTVSGMVTLTNTGAEAISGSTAVEAAITLARDGVTVWHSYATEVSQPWEAIHLAPGQSIEYPAEFTPVLCRHDGDLRPEYAGDLPPLGAGEYEVSAYLFLAPATGNYPHDILLGGPAQQVTLR
jgi:hypothetical protein